MPIGTPSVPYRLPGSQYERWVDIYTRLGVERILFLGQEVNDGIANSLVAQMLYLDSDDNTKPIYLFTLNKKYTLDGDFTWNTAGLINHSCDNNCDYNGKGLKVWITAIRDIKKGEEFTCDYGFGYDEDYKQFPCKCGSKNCCGYIVREESRWRINKKFAMRNKKKLTKEK